MRRPIGAAIACAALAYPLAARAQGQCPLPRAPLPPTTCPVDVGPSDFVFDNPPCSYTTGAYADISAQVLPHYWPLPGGAVRVEREPGLGMCHTRLTVRHVRGRRARGPGAVDLDDASCAALRRLAPSRGGTAFTVDSAWGQRPSDHWLRAEHVERIAAVGGAQLTLDLAIRRSADLALLAPLADRIVSLRVRRAGRPVDLSDLPSIPCLVSLAVEGREVRGVASLRSPSLTALEVRGRLPDADVAAIAAIASLRELRVWPRGAARIARFSAVRQIERLHTRASAPVLDAFARAPLRRLVLDGPAGRGVLRAVAAHFTDLRVLDVALHPSLGGRAVRGLGALTHLETLLLTWYERPPRLPSLPAVRMFVTGGALDRRTVGWINAQPALRTVHTPMLDEALQPLLRRARSYTIARDLVQEELATAPPDPLDL